MSYILKMLDENKELQYLKHPLNDAFSNLCKCFKFGGKALLCGNGGGASDAEHITGELMKGFLLKRPITESDAIMIKSRLADEAETICNELQRGLPAICLSSQTSLLTAILNDSSADMIFAQQVYVYGRKGDVLIAISTSGNSKNIINAAKIACAMGIKVIGMTGESGGELKYYCDVLINAPSDKCEKIQEYDVKLYHALCADIEEEFFNEGRTQ